jgi:hypothetical protein
MPEEINKLQELDEDENENDEQGAQLVTSHSATSIAC